MFKYILVPATGADTDAVVFSTALAVARLSGSHLEFLHVRLDAQRALTAMATADMGGGVGFDGLLEFAGAGCGRKAEESRAGLPRLLRAGKTLRLERSLHLPSFGGMEDGGR